MGECAESLLERRIQMRRARLGVMLIEQGPTTNDDISDIMIDVGF